MPCAYPPAVPAFSYRVTGSPFLPSTVTLHVQLAAVAIHNDEMLNFTESMVPPGDFVDDVAEKSTCSSACECISDCTCRRVETLANLTRSKYDNALVLISQ